MKSRFSVLALVVLGAVWLPASTYAGSGPSAHGGGSTFIPGLDRTVFGFTAVTHRDGTVTGQFEVRSTLTGEGAHADVQCLDVQGGDTATFSGVVSHGELGGVDLTGLCYVATGQDNGEGAASPPDFVSFVLFAPCGFLPAETACTVAPQPAVLEVITGNVQVRP
ncbi:MAG: hypothetical protein GY719_06060 [bacterium]|nr:hypothetical protein [bacterium]